MVTLTANIVGIVAAVIGTSMMLPQVIKSLKTKNVEDLSMSTLFLYFLNCALWGIYGILINAFPVILANSIGFIIAITQISIKIRYAKN